MSESKTRINKYLSEAGFCSRRAADKLIEQGKVTINGVVPEMGTKIGPEDEVRVNGELISKKEEILQACREFEYFNNQTRKSSEFYLTEFFNDIESEKRAKGIFCKNCKPMVD